MRLFKIAYKSTKHTKLDKKRKLNEAFTKLEKEVARKKQKMVDEKKNKDEAHRARVFYLEKIKKFEKSLSQEQFEKFSEYDLLEKTKRLEELFDKFEAKCMALNCIDGASGTNEEDDEIEALCTALKSKITQKVRKFNEQKKVAQSSAAPAQVKSKQEVVSATSKPTMQNTWGIFTGDLNGWHNFSKRFKTTIHENVQMLDTQKYEMLKQACKDNAADVVFNAEDDYQLAWRRLNEVYGEAYMQIHFCMHKISLIKKIDNASVTNMKELVIKGKDIMQILGEVMPNKEFEAFITVMLADKLDNETARAWERHRVTLAESWAMDTNNEQHRNASMFIPSWEEFCKFLQCELDIHTKIEMRLRMQGVSTSSGCNSNTQAALNTASKCEQSRAMKNVQSQQAWDDEKRRAPEFMQCKLCDGVHALYKCEVYVGMGYRQKWQCVKDYKLCQRCLKKDHLGSCENKLNNEKCQKCYESGYSRTVSYHNSSLCPVRYGLPPNSITRVDDYENWE